MRLPQKKRCHPRNFLSGIKRDPRFRGDDKFRGNDKGATMVELIIVVAIIAILAKSFSQTYVPLMNAFFYFPQSSRVNGAGADAVDIIFEGDWRSSGLRFTGQACNIGGGGGSGSTITAASATSLTYNYANPDYCGDGTRMSHAVVVAYDSANHVRTRAIDGGAAVNIPDYATSSAGIKLDPPSGVSFFRYCNDVGSEMKGAGINLAAIYRVDVTLISSSGSGVVQNDAGQTQLKAGIDIKRYTAAPAACWATTTLCTLDSQCCSGSCL